MNRLSSLKLVAGALTPLISVTSARADDTVKISVVAPPTEDYGGMYYAARSSSMKKAGFDITLASANSGAAGMAAVLGRQYELCKANPVGIASAHVHGIDIRVVLPANVHDSRQPLALLQVAAASTAATGADLNGKTIGVPSVGDLNTLAIRSWVDKNGGDSKTLKFIELPNSVLEVALTEHRVDAAVLQSPQVFVSIANGATRTLGDAWSAIAPRFYAGMWVGRTEWVAANQAAIQRLRPPYFEAEEYVMRHPAETASLISEITNIPAADVLKMRRSIYGTSLDPALFQPVIDVAYKYGVIDRSFAAKDMIG